jgi:hypothetical protein
MIFDSSYSCLFMIGRRVWLNNFKILIVYFRSTEDSHVKTNLVHTLYRVQKYGKMEIKKIFEMLRPSERKQCMYQVGRKTWYSMPAEVFTSFNFRVSFNFPTKPYFKIQKWIMRRRFSFLWLTNSIWWMSFAAWNLSGCGYCCSTLHWQDTCWGKNWPRSSWRYEMSSTRQSLKVAWEDGEVVGSCKSRIWNRVSRTGNVRNLIEIKFVLDYFRDDIHIQRSNFIL